jgi:hypothetical protein
MGRKLCHADQTELAQCRRLQALVVALRPEPSGVLRVVVQPASAVNGPMLQIGDVGAPLFSPLHPEFVPTGFGPASGDAETGEVARHLRWLMQKDLNGQDAFLIGPPGPRRRRLAMRYAELRQREVEYLCLSRDTTEADLKQRREIVAGGSTSYTDQPPVRAALNGRLLVLDGLERCERNVLPTLNNCK